MNLSSACSANERIEKLGLFALMREQNKPGAERPFMSPPEKARNFALKTEIQALRARLTALSQELQAIPWDKPRDIPLLTLEDEIEVPFLRVSSTTSHRSTCQAHDKVML